MSLEYNIELFKHSMEFCFGRNLKLCKEDGSTIEYNFTKEFLTHIEKYVGLKHRLNSLEEMKVVFDIKELEDTMLELENNFNTKELVYYTGKRYEIQVGKTNNKIGPMRIRNIEKKYDISNEEISIRIKEESSKTFVLFTLIQCYINYNDRKVNQSMLYFTNTIARLIDYDIPESEYINGLPESEGLRNEDTINKEIDGFKVIRDNTNLSLEITSEKKLNIEEFEDYKYAYLFNLALNYGESFYQVEKYNIYRFIRVLDTSRDSLYSKRSLEMDIPRKKYNKELVNYYQMAISSDNLLVKYLSLYHILEFFFENVYYDKLIQQVKDDISSPSFSLKDNDSVKKFIKNFEKKVGIQKGDGIVFNEFNALKLILQKYIKLKDIEHEMEEYSINLINYYKNEGCSFSGAKKVNFTNFETIASRLYKNRNALVHSKDTDKEKYRPFKDEEVLNKEIPLIKIIAENIIINSGELI